MQSSSSAGRLFRRRRDPDHDHRQRLDAGAWAIDDNGASRCCPSCPPDEMQREMSFRSGVNIMMYMLTGNYKADQVHVPALLERLGQ